MHKRNRSPPLRARPPPHLIQLAKLHANLDTYTEPSGHQRAQSTNMHADTNAARYTLLHSGSAETSLFSEHPVPRSSPGAFRPLLGHPAPPRQDKTNNVCQNLSCLKRVSLPLEPFSRPDLPLHVSPHPTTTLCLALAGARGRHVRNVLQ